MAVSAPSSKNVTPEAEQAETAEDRVQALRGTRREQVPQAQEAHPGPRSAAEWITLALSSLIVLGLIGVTTYFYLTGSTEPAAVEVEPRLVETYQAGGRFYLPVTIRNTGGTTGQDVHVRVSVTDPSGRQEASELVVDFLAGGGASRAVAVFGSDPRQGQLEAVVVSYMEP
jgi:uncharacterized protein (TIGR02588 family)